LSQLSLDRVVIADLAPLAATGLVIETRFDASPNAAAICPRHPAAPAAEASQIFIDRDS
jgi:hypothetical protein